MLLPLIINNFDIIFAFFVEHWAQFFLIGIGFKFLIDTISILVSPNFEESEKLELEEPYEEVYEVKVKKIKKKKNKK